MNIERINFIFVKSETIIIRNYQNIKNSRERRILHGNYFPKVFKIFSAITRANFTLLSTVHPAI